MEQTSTERFAAPNVSEHDESWLSRYFGVRRRGSTVRTEVLAGVATFLAGMYIIVVNPAILSDAGIPFSAALSASRICMSRKRSASAGRYRKL